MTLARPEAWLLDVTLDGRVFHYATIPGTLDDGTEYVAGLADLTVPRGADSVDVTITDPTVDWPSAGRYLDGGDAVLRRTSDADPVEYVSGEVRVLSWGARHESVTLRVERRPGASSLGYQIPDVLARVGDDTFPVTAAHVAGTEGSLTYPVIFGYPGYQGTGDNTFAVVPVPLAQWKAGATSTTLVVVAEDGQAEIDHVLLRNEDRDLEAIEDTAATVDLLNRSILTANFTADTSIAASSAGTVFYAGYYPSGGGGPRSAYDVLVYALRRWGGSSVDWARLPEIADALAAYQIDDWVNSPVTDPWSWFESTFLGALPFETRTSDLGRYLVERRYVSDPRRNVGSVVVGAGAAISGRVGLSDEGPYNEFCARYRIGRSGDFLATAYLTGREGIQSARRSAGTLVPGTSVTVRSGRCAASAARYGPRQAEPIDLDWCCDDGTAVRVLEVAAERSARPARMVSYQVDGGEDFDEGDEVTLYDEDRGLDGVAAIVDGPPVVGSASVTVPFRVPA